MTCVNLTSEIRTSPCIYRTAYCGPIGVLIMEVSLYRTAYCGPNGVLIMEVSLYRTAYCGPNGVLIMEVSLYWQWGETKSLLIEVVQVKKLESIIKVT